MVSHGSLAAITIINAIFLTQSLRMTGHFRSLHARFSDALNSTEYEHFLMYDVRLQSLREPADATAHRVANLAVRRQSILLAIPDESRAGHERTASQQGLRVDRKEVRTLLDIHPFQILGNVHITPGSDLLTHVFESHDVFMPLTNVEVSYEPNPEITMTVPFLLVNRHAIEVALDVSLMGGAEAEPQETDVAIAAPVIRNRSLTAARATDLLAATPIFGVANREQLGALLTQLCDKGLVVQKNVTEGAEVFRQGDLGDTMYIVENGLLEVWLLDQRGQHHRLAEFRNGDFLGEMAVLGDKRRSASVRAVVDSSLVALHEDAVKALMQQFPSVARNLLALMVQRQANNQQRTGAR